METIILEPALQPEISSIYVGRGALHEIGQIFDFEPYSSAFVVTDEDVKPHWLDALVEALPIESTAVALPAGEAAKNQASVNIIRTALDGAGSDRETLGINLGGGVVSDLGGYAVSTFMRRLDFINVPTTLMAQADASIGGKTGFNAMGRKNLIGTLALPKAVIVDPDTLGTIDKPARYNGFAEVVKHGLIRDKNYFQSVTAQHPTSLTPDQLTAVIAGSCRIKAQVVAEDFKENGVRKILNFGHTVGHAIEALSLETSSPLPHGEAVSIGIMAESLIACYSGMLPSTDLRRIHTDLRNTGLPTVIPPIDIKKILAKMRQDKKNTAGDIKLVLIDKIGNAMHDQLVDEEDIATALRVLQA